MTLEISQSWTPALRTLGRVLMGVSRLLGPRTRDGSNLEASRGRRGELNPADAVLGAAPCPPSSLRGAGRFRPACPQRGASPHGAHGEDRRVWGHERSPSGAVTVLERLDWAPGAGDAKWPLSRDPCTGASMARAPPEASESGLLPLPAPGPRSQQCHVPTSRWPRVLHHSRDSRLDGPPVPSLGSGHPPATAPCTDTSAPNQSLPGPVWPLRLLAPAALRGAKTL